MVPIPDRGKPGVLSVAFQVRLWAATSPPFLSAFQPCLSFSHTSDVRHVSASGPLHVLFTLPGALNLPVSLLRMYPGAWLTAGAQ